MLFQAYYLKCHAIIPLFKIGITKLRFKPAYNPYTEPSMEVFSYHEGKIGSLFFSAFTHAVFSLFVKYWCWPKQLIWGCRGYLSRFPSVSHLYSHISITVRMQFDPIAGSEPNVPCILGCGQHFIRNIKLMYKMQTETKDRAEVLQEIKCSGSGLKNHKK